MLAPLVGYPIETIFLSKLPVSTTVAYIGPFAVLLPLATSAGAILSSLIDLPQSPFTGLILTMLSPTLQGDSLGSSMVTLDWDRRSLQGVWPVEFLTQG